MHNLLKFLTYLLLATTSLTFGEESKRVLHISTIPSYADVYVGKVKPNHAKEPDYQAPAYIDVSSDISDNGRVLISLFKPEFKDTTIKVILSHKDTSFLIVNLTPVYEEQIINEQNAELSRRARKNFGKKMMISSAIPFVAGGIASLITLYEIDQANQAKDVVDRMTIATDDNFKQANSKFKEHRDNAKQARKATYIGAIAGAALFSVGLILSF